MNAQREERQKFIVANLSSGNMSMVDLGKKFGISRERISQIYYTAIGSKKRGSLLKNRRERQRQNREAWLNSIKYNCASCGTPVAQRESQHKKTYCQKCHTISQKERRSMQTTLECTRCGKAFHPFYNCKLGQKRKIGYFCSRECYTTYIVEHGINPKKV